MAFFTAIGTISNDIVRRETKNGVVATFRLETGAPRGRKLWIDVECWGHLAGTVASHGEPGRTVHLSGQLKQPTWRDSSGASRSRLVVVAHHCLLISEAIPPTRNQVSAVGRLRHLDTTQTRGWHVARFQLQTRRAGTTVRTLRLTCERWTKAMPNDVLSTSVAVAGSLTFGHGRSMVLTC